MNDEETTPDPVPSRLDRVKKHLKDNKTTYLIAGATGITCLVVGGLVGKRMAPDVIQSFQNSNDNLATVINRSKDVDVVITYLNRRNYNALPVRCLETMEEWASQAEAALAKNISETNLSQHLNGKQSSVSNLHFERIIA
jgi:hypothetical protein